MTGYFADRTRKYWLVTFVGYVINMLAVPALALAGNWPVAAGLIVAERTGRAIRKPAVEAMLSDAGKSIGAGWAFGLHEALDQAGAMVGPLVAALILFQGKSYQSAFAVLLVSALLCLGIVAIARLVHARGAPPEKAAVAFTRGARLLESILDLPRRRRAHRRRFCRFFADRLSFPQSIGGS